MPPNTYSRHHGSVVTPQDPSNVPCEWCGDPSVKAVRIAGRATHMYACGDHVQTAMKANEKKPRQRRIP